MGRRPLVIWLGNSLSRSRRRNRYRTLTDGATGYPDNTGDLSSLDDIFEHLAARNVLYAVGREGDKGKRGEGGGYVDDKTAKSGQ